MENKISKISKIITDDDAVGITSMLCAHLDPNFKDGWPLRFAARSGSFSVAKILIQYGANPHLLDKSGASALELAVLSGRHWRDDSWQLLLSTSSAARLADGAAVAVVLRRLDALRTILRTGRCDTNVSTSLTGRTVEDLARSYNLVNMVQEVSPVHIHLKKISGNSTTKLGRTNLSPSVARFFASSSSAQAPAQLTSLSPQPPSHALTTHVTFFSPVHATSWNT